MHDNWPWYLVTDEARFLGKKMEKNLGPMSLNQAENKVFRHFIEYGYVFLEIRYNDRLWQCLTSSKHEAWSPPLLESKAHFQELIKKTPKSETIIDNCVSLIKRHWKKITEIPQTRDFLTWSIQNFIRKVKHLVKKICYLINWLS